MPIGVPFDILEYSILLSMVANVSGLKPGRLTHIITNAHIYENQINEVHEQLRRLPIENTAKLKINPNVKNFYDYKLEDIEIVDYKSHDAIKYQVSE